MTNMVQTSLKAFRNYVNNACVALGDMGVGYRDIVARLALRNLYSLMEITGKSRKDVTLDDTDACIRSAMLAVSYADAAFFESMKGYEYGSNR